MKTTVIAILACVFLGICTSVLAQQPADRGGGSSKMAAIAQGVVIGGLKGATACALPMIVGLYAGPVGLVIGGIITLYCLPFGVTLGAIAGAANAAFPAHGETKENKGEPIPAAAEG